MRTRILAALVMAIIAAPGSLAANARITSELRKIPSVETGNVMSRMTKCGITLQKNSWAEPVFADNPSNGDRKDDFIVWAYINVPMPIGWDPKERDNFTGLNAGWRLRAGKYEPITGWAKKLSEKPFPLDWLQC